jgi:hypothetical protein
MIRRINVTLICAVLFVDVRPAAAQEASRWYLAAGPMFSWQAAGTPPDTPDMPKPGVGGRTFGIVGEFGAMLSRRISVAGEISLPARFVAMQELRYGSSDLYENHHRDLMVSGLLHVRAGPTQTSSKIRPEFVAGLSYVREDTLRRTADKPVYPPTSTYGPFVPAPPFTRDTFAITVGTDVTIAVTKHLAFVPQARFHWIRRADLTEPAPLNAFLFLGAAAVRAAVAARASF